MNDILEKAFVEDSGTRPGDRGTQKFSDSDSDIEDKFNNRVLNCLGSHDESIMDPHYSHDSSNAEWKIYINGDRLRSCRGFSALQYWKRGSERPPRLARLARLARVVFAFAARSTSCERGFCLAHTLLVIGVIARQPGPLKASYALSTIPELYIHCLRKISSKLQYT
jgi:hypothetical protein